MAGMDAKPSKPAKEPQENWWTPYVKALELGLSILVGGVMGMVLLSAVTSGPDDTADKMIRGTIVGAILGPLVYKVANWLDRRPAH
jgi:hypothetical protein